MRKRERGKRGRGEKFERMMKRSERGVKKLLILHETQKAGKLIHSLSLWSSYHYSQDYYNPLCPTELYDTLIVHNIMCILYYFN